MQIYEVFDESLRDPLSIPRIFVFYFILYSLHLIRRTESRWERRWHFVYVRRSVIIFGNRIVRKYRFMISLRESLVISIARRLRRKSFAIAILDIAFISTLFTLAKNISLVIR